MENHIVTEQYTHTTTSFARLQSTRQSGSRTRQCREATVDHIYFQDLAVGNILRHRKVKPGWLTSRPDKNKANT